MPAPPSRLPTAHSHSFLLTALGCALTELGAGEQMVVDTNSLVAWNESVTMDIRMAGGLATCCCGGEGMFNTVMTGPGTVYLQSMSFKKFKESLKMAIQANAAGSGAGAGTGAFSGAPPSSDEMAR